MRKSHLFAWAMQGSSSTHARSDSFGEFQIADEPLELGTNQQDDRILDLRPIEQKLDAHRHEQIAEAITTEQAGPSSSLRAIEHENTEQKDSKPSSYAGAIWSKLPLPQFLELLALIRMPRRIGIVGIGHYPRLSSHAIGSRFPSFSRIGTKTRTR